MLYTWYTLCDLLNFLPYIFEFLLMQNLSIRSESVVYVYPIESSKTSLYYSMQFLKVHLPNVVIKVDPL